MILFNYLLNRIFSVLDNILKLLLGVPLVQNLLVNMAIGEYTKAVVTH